MNGEQPYYPSWLGSDLFDDAFPWEQGIMTSASAFLGSYSLHDSIWITLLLDPQYDGSGVAVVRWDTFWTDSRVAYPGSFVAEWPILLARFSSISSVAFEGFQDSGGSPRTISHADTQLNAGSGDQVELHKTSFCDIYGGKVHITHGTPIRLLCLNRNRDVLPIPGLA